MVNSSNRILPVGNFSGLLLVGNFNSFLSVGNYTDLLNFGSRKNITTLVNKTRNQNNLTKILNEIKLELFDGNTIKTQKEIEITLYNNYENIFNKSLTKPKNIGGIKLDLLGSSLSKYVHNRKHNLEKYVSNLTANFSSKIVLENVILRSFDEAYIINFCL